MKRWKSCVFALTLALFAVCAVPASALEFSYDAPEDYLFGRPTSDDTVYEWENPNQDRSKNTSLIPPGFGTPTSYLPNSGEYLTPNLVPGALNGGLVNETGSAGNSAVMAGNTGDSSVEIGSDGFPVVQASVTSMAAQPDSSAPQFVDTANDSGSFSSSSGYTEVTSDLYYSGGSLGRLEIPSLGLSVKIYEGTDSATLAKGIGHFKDTSIWDGNVSLAAHNRGTNNYFGKIHTLSAGDTIVLTTQLGTRTYAVTDVEKVSETDTSGTSSAADNCITLFTCVMDEREYRWCVRGVEV